MRAWRGLLALAVWAGACAPAAAGEGPAVLRADSVTVTAERLGGMEGMGEYRVRVELSNTAYAYSTTVRGADRAAQLKDIAVVERDGYLFTAKGCGGCNAWRGYGWVVARLGARPALLGYVAGGPEGSPYFPYKAGRFTDGFDALEINDLTSHAGAPGFTVVLRDGERGLEGLADETWERNQDRWKLWLRASRGPAGEQRDGALLGRAALAKWCGRGGALKAARASARKALNKGQRKAFDEALARVAPQAPPSQALGD